MPTSGTGVVARIPTRVLMALTLVVLLLPAAWMTLAYWRDTQSKIAFSVAESDGVVVVSALYAVADAAVEARTAAAAGDPVAPGPLDDAVAAAEQVLADRGASWDLDAGWDELVGQIEAARATAGQSPTEQFEAWNGAVGAANALIVGVADASNLTLDPDLDSFYLMSATTVHIPALLDAGTQAGSVAGLGPVQACGSPEPLAPAAAGALCLSVGGIAAAGVETDLTRAQETTLDPALKASLATDADTLAALLEAASAPGAPPDTLARGLATLHAGVSDDLAGLLDARVGGFRDAMRTVLVVLAVSLVAALALFVGLWRRIAATMRATATSAQDVADRAAAAAHEADAIRRTTASMATASGEVSEALSMAAAASSGVSTVVQTVSHDAEAASQRVASMATATAQMGTSVREVARSASSTAGIAGEAVRLVDDTAAALGELEAASHRVSEIAAVVARIAGQTNMLALNAAIEASRFGDQGRGFAVVAAQVKELSTSTEAATADIRHTVADIAARATSAGEAMRQVVDTMATISAHQAAIAASVEEQTASTDEIAHALEQTAALVGQLAEHVERAARDAERIAVEVEQGAARSSEVTDGAHAVARSADAVAGALAASRDVAEAIAREMGHGNGEDHGSSDSNGSRATAGPAVGST